MKATRDISTLWGLAGHFDQEIARQDKISSEIRAADPAADSATDGTAGAVKVQCDANGVPLRKTVDMCPLCNVPLLSEQDRVLHEKGKKHRKKVKLNKNLGALSSVANACATGIATVLPAGAGSREGNATEAEGKEMGVAKKPRTSAE